MDFKHGYVRDDWHETTAMMGLSLAAMAGLAVAWPVTARYVRLAGPLLLIIILILASSTFRRWSSGKTLPVETLPVELAHTLNFHRVLAPVRMLYEPEYLSEAYETNLAGVRINSPFIPWKEMWTSIPGIRPPSSRTVCITRTSGPAKLFCLHTELAELNAACLRSSQAASNILFGVEPIDGRFPSLEDGHSWPELLTRYDIKGTNEAAGKYCSCRGRQPRGNII